VEEARKNETQAKRQNDALLQEKRRESDVKGRNLDLNEDLNNRSEMRSQMSEGQKSIAESRAEERIEQLKVKATKGKQEFDNVSQVGESVGADDYERMAKNVADKVLQSHKDLRDKHSNKSIRTLLEREALKELRQGPTIVVHKDKDIEQGQRFSKNGLNMP